MENKKKGFKMPDTYVIIVGLIILMVILTWIIPAGKYDVAEDGKTVLAGTYHLVEKSPAGIKEFLDSFYLGMQKGAATIFIAFIIGGAFQILIEAGTIEATIGAAIKKTQGNYKLIIPVLMFVMSLLGVLGCGQNCGLAFCGIVLILCKKLKLDKMVVMSCMYLASNTGFAASWMNPFTVLLGQNIAGLAPMSGAGIRVAVWILFTALIIWYTMRYCQKIIANPDKSLAPFEAGEFESDNSGIEEVTKFTAVHVINLLILVATFVVFGYGTMKWNWGLSNLGTCLMAMAFLCGIVSRMNPNTMAQAFVKGAKGMTYTALLVGFASAINVIMTNANIIHTIIYALCIPLANLASGISAVGMFLVNFVFNFFVPSGSGQCYVVMPLFIPMADLLGVTRQVAVSAFQLGDGLCNAIIPTTGLLMGTLGIAKVSFDKWLKFALPITGILALCSSIFLVVMNSIGWM